MAGAAPRVRRIYDPPEEGDGLRVLVDRLWPRGVTRDRAAIDLWLKEVAPSPELRRWFGHDPEKWDEFSRRYRVELEGRSAELGQLREVLQTGPVTLLYGARDTAHNHALVLADYLRHADSENSNRPQRTMGRLTPRWTKHG